MLQEYTIMFTDIVGYTRLIRQDEDILVKILQHHQKVHSASVAIHTGKLIQCRADGSLSLFKSASQAISAAIAIQEGCHAPHNIPVRIGIHKGGVRHVGEEIVGDSLNTAFRIRTIANEGSILISEETYEEVKGRVDFIFKRLGLFNLKHTPDPALLYVTGPAGSKLPGRDEFRDDASAPENSIAVLPFRDLSASQNQEYLGQGMSEEIINNLVKIDGLKVTARTSSFAIARRELDIREIGKMLGVAHVLEGSVRKEDNRVRITAQLINARDGFHEFSESFTREIQDIFLIQQEISVRIVQLLKDIFDLGPDKDRLSTYKTNNLDAYDLYLKGRYELGQGTKENIEKAIAHFSELINMQPDYALAYSGLSQCYLSLGAMDLIDKDIAYAKMEAAVEKAMELDPDLAENQIAQNLSEFWRSGWNLGKYYKLITNALATNPGSADLRMYYGMYHLISGRTDEALIEIQLAYRLDPLSLPIRLRLVRVYYCREEFDMALEICNAILEEHPRFYPALGSKAWILALSGQYQHAVEVFRELPEGTMAHDYKFSGLAFAFMHMGNPEEALNCLQKLRERAEVGNLTAPDYHFALIYQAMGKEEEMFRHMTSGIENRDFNFLFVKSDPMWKKYHSDTRYIKLVKDLFVGDQEGKYIILQTDTHEEFEFNLGNLCYIEAEDNYSRVFLLENDTLREKLLRVTLKGIEQQIDDPDIVRCHRSYIINLSMAFEIKGDASGYFLTSKSIRGKIPISRSKGKLITTSLRERQG